MSRFAADDLAVTLGIKVCHGEQCDVGDTCTNITNTVRKPAPSPKPAPRPGPKSQMVIDADIDALLAQLRKPIAGD